MTDSRQVVKKSGVRGKTGAGAAGAGSGTLLVLLANNLPDHNPWKSWLVLLAPSASIAISVIYSWVRKAIDENLETRKTKRWVAEAKQILNEGFENPNTSEAHRKKLRSRMEELEMLLVTSSIERVRVVEISGIHPEPQ